jgi:hypothetical protein
MNFNFKYFGLFDINGFLEKLESLDWNFYKFRQIVHKVHAETLTVPMLFDEKLESIKIHKDFGRFIPELEKIKIILHEKIGKGEFQSAILINLPAGKTIKRHIDKGEKFKKYHRIHIPIQTNPKCFFEVDKEIINMKEGEIWEINNDDKYHSVENRGETDRIHLLIDWKVSNR